MSKKPNGKKPKNHPNFNNLKQARAECREKALRGSYPYPLCWDKNRGYYCPEQRDGYPEKDYVCAVDRSGAFTWVHKEVLKVHNLKNYVNPAWWEEYVKRRP